MAPALLEVSGGGYKALSPFFFCLRLRFFWFFAYFLFIMIGSVASYKSINFVQRTS
jgi:hypothetical protein